MSAAQLRVVHLFVVNQVAAGINYGHCHVPIILARFGQRSRCGLFGVLYRYGRTIGIGQHLRASMPGTQHNDYNSHELYGLL